MEDKDKKKQEEDYLKKFLKETKEDISEIKQTIKRSDQIPLLDYISVDLDILPLGLFYPEGTQIKIRAAKVQEVQAYSVVDDKNLLDVTEKMNQMLASCVKVTLPNGKQGSYKDLKDGDRLFIIFMIRELTFQKGNSLAKEHTCEHCQHEFKIPFRATSNSDAKKTFEFYEMPTKLEKFFNRHLKCFEINVNGETFKLGMPTIGIQEAFYNDIKNKVQAKKATNVAFLKIIPFFLYDRISITEEGIKAKEEEFKKMDMYAFQVVNQAVNLMVFGIKGLTTNCPSCGAEVHSDMTFPGGASSIFVVSDPFDNLVEE